MKTLFALEALKSGIRWPEFATASAMLFLINIIKKGMVTGAHISTTWWLVSVPFYFFSSLKFKSTFKKVKVHFTVTILIALVHLKFILPASIEEPLKTHLHSIH